MIRQSNGKYKRDFTRPSALCVFAYITMFLIAIGLIKSFLDIPVVYRSNASGECIRVDDPKFSCNSLPKKYHTIWSK